MANNPRLRPTICQAGALPSLVALLNDSDCSYHAVQAIAQFAADTSYRSVLGKLGGRSSPLVPSSSDPPPSLPSPLQASLAA